MTDNLEEGKIPDEKDQGPIGEEEQASDVRPQAGDLRPLVDWIPRLGQGAKDAARLTAAEPPPSFPDTSLGELLTGSRASIRFQKGTSQA